jgi:hypothetical protein
MIDYGHHCNCVQEFGLCRLLANGYWLDGVSLVGRINWGGGFGMGAVVGIGVIHVSLNLT